ncbi:hypothetical protein TRICI_005336 [Trichomonascus ciferrii]|uniref:Mitochondrial fission 1 protein n=1 Tax=Trichomonascus ciferrii TaxID=44093 RepID=A0A642UT96_9ASCO|nr:hypothetical protein TRICI_005336 [Trichomonascus ciferrii]
MNSMAKEDYLPGNPLSDAELKVLRDQYEQEGEYVSLQVRFNYAWGLIKSNRVSDQQEGVKLLTQVFKDAPQRRRECLYYLSVGSFKLGDYTNARKYCDILLEYEPDNRQVTQLRQAIEDKLNKGKYLLGALLFQANIIQRVSWAWPLSVALLLSVWP